ncbi:hypothetical protein NW062_05430 [Mycoplasmopsis cynos]|nr:hypothetical protein NW062_05430 [Mycoplasmopsis cynos]
MFENHPDVDRVIVTNSIDNTENVKKFKKLQIVSLGDFLAKVINASLKKTSISQIYIDYKKEI